MVKRFFILLLTELLGFISKGEATRLDPESHPSEMVEGNLNMERINAIT